jgi:hypothetical protein
MSISCLVGEDLDVLGLEICSPRSDLNAEYRMSNIPDIIFTVGARPRISHVNWHGSRVDDFLYLAVTSAFLRYTVFTPNAHDSILDMGNTL